MKTDHNKHIYHISLALTNSHFTTNQKKQICFKLNTVDNVYFYAVVMCMNVSFGLEAKHITSDNSVYSCNVKQK